MASKVSEEYQDDEATPTSSSSSDENSDEDPEFKIAESLEIDEKNEKIGGKTKKKYRCHVCGKKFPFPNKVKEHMETHKSGRYTCPECPELHFDTHGQLRAHNAKSHSTASHTCPVCPFNSNRRFFVAQHFQKNHVEGIPCTIEGCSLKFAKNRLKHHIREAHDGKKMRVAPKRARILEHNEPTIECTMSCGAEILEHNLLQHLNSTCPNFQTTEAPPTCSEEPPPAKKFRYQEKRAESDEPNELQCEICGKQCRKLEALKKHVKLNHSSSATDSRPPRKEARIQKQWICEREKGAEPCGKKFRTQQALQDHFNVHDDIKPYHCSTCQQSFYARDRFAVHLQKYHRTSIKDLNANEHILGNKRDPDTRPDTFGALSSSGEHPDISRPDTDAPNAPNPEAPPTSESLSSSEDPETLYQDSGALKSSGDHPDISRPDTDAPNAPNPEAPPTFEPSGALKSSGEHPDAPNAPNQDFGDPDTLSDTAHQHPEAPPTSEPLSSSEGPDKDSGAPKCAPNPETLPDKLEVDVDLILTSL